MEDGCRFRFPRLIVTPGMQDKAAAESRDFFQVQKNSYVVSHNPVATTELPCNQCLEVCPGTKGSIIYTVSYVSKVDGVRDTDTRATELLALEALRRYIDAGRQVAPERLTEKMTLSCVNKINSMAHLSMPLITTYLMVSWAHSGRDASLLLDPRRPSHRLHHPRATPISIRPTRTASSTWTCSGGACRGRASPCSRGRGYGRRRKAHRPPLIPRTTGSTTSAARRMTGLWPSCSGPSDATSAVGGRQSSRRSAGAHP